jgi:hypothetical protein
MGPLAISLLDKASVSVLDKASVPGSQPILDWIIATNPPLYPEVLEICLLSMFLFGSF